MSIELNGQNDIVRRNGNLPDEVVATKAGPSLTSSEIAYLESLPPQSALKQAYLASTAKTVLPGYQVEQVQALVSGAGTQLINGGTAGQDSGAVPYTPGMRLAYALDSGSTATAFSVDILAADGVTSLGQAFTGTWASTTAEISPPIWLTNTQARFIRFNVLGAGPLSVIKF